VTFAIVRAPWLLVAPVALFPGCFLIVGDLPPPLPEEAAAAGATESAVGDGGGGSGGKQGTPGPGGGPSSGGSAGAAGGQASNECDTDHDDHLARGECGGEDCDDTDPEIFPEQPEYFAEPRDNGTYDYDCSGHPELEQTDAIVCTGFSLLSCPTDQQGFLGSLPACGEKGRWGKCVTNSLLNTCEEPATVTSSVMRCH
jgi:hypothetical protein